jgi:hypothetical protein
MKFRRKREVVVQHERRLTIRYAGGSREQFCPFCSGPAPFVSTDEAALLAGVSSRSIYQLADDGMIHSAETAEGLTTICLNSLSALGPIKQRSLTN